MVMNLRRDAITSQHWFLVMTMGRKSGHLALGIGKSAMATITLIPEEWSHSEIRLREVVDILVTTILLRLLEILVQRDLRRPGRAGRGVGRLHPRIRHAVVERVQRGRRRERRGRRCAGR